MRWKILITAPYFQPVVERFRPILAQHDCEIVVPPVQERLEEEELLHWIQDIDGVICGDDRYTERVLQSAPRLKVLSKWGTGIDSMDQAACQRLGIVIRNTPNAFSEPVGDTVLGYMLSFVRHIPWTDRAMKSGEWYKIPSRTLAECTLGIIGVGNTGKAVARRGKALGMTLLGNDLIAIPPEFLAETGITMVSKEEVLKNADFVSLHCDLNPTSFHIADEAALALMQPTAVLINTARGPLVDEPALIRALQEKRLAGAALDVFEQEPLPKDSPLLTMDNVLLAPHNANSSPRAWERIHHATVDHLLESLRLSTRP